MARRYRAAVAATAALVLVGVWVDISGYLDVFTNPQITDATQEVAHYACYVGRLVMALGFLVFPARFERLTNSTVVLMASCMMAGSLLYSLGFYQSLFSPLVICAVGSFLVGGGHVWAVSAAYCLLTRTHDRRAVFIAIIAAQIGERLLMEVLNLAWAGLALVVVSYALPVLAVGLLALSSRVSARRTPEVHEPATGVAVRYFGVLCAMAGVGLVACGAMSSVGIWGNAGGAQFQGEAATLPLVLVECGIVVALCWTTFMLSERKPLALRYQTSLLVLITAFVISLSRSTLSFLPEGPVSALLVAVENYAHILFWVVAVDAAISTCWQPYRAFGVGIVACSAAGLPWSVFYERQLVAAESSVLIVFYLMVIGCIVYPQAFNRGALRASRDEEMLNVFALVGEQRATPGVNGSALQFALGERCAHLARQYGLSPREGEVLLLTVKGITRKAICSELCLSEGTVKTHLSHIYGKTDVHSQADLLDIVYDVGSGGEGARSKALPLA